MIKLIRKQLVVFLIISLILTISATAYTRTVYETFENNSVQNWNGGASITSKSVINGSFSLNASMTGGADIYGRSLDNATSYGATNVNVTFNYNASLINSWAVVGLSNVQTSPGFPTFLGFLQQDSTPNFQLYDNSDYKFHCKQNITCPIKIELYVNDSKNLIWFLTVNGTRSGEMGVSGELNISNVHYLNANTNGLGDKNQLFLDDIEVVSNNNFITNFTIFSSSGISNFSVYIEGDREYKTTTGYVTTPYLNNDTNLYNLNISLTDTNNYLNYSYYNVNVSSNLYINDSKITILAYNLVNNSYITEYNTTLIYNNLILNKYTSNGNLEFGLFQNNKYNLTFLSNSYESKNIDINPNLSSTNYNFSVYGYNSVRINIFNELNGVLITNPTDVKFTSNLGEFTNTTASGTLYVENLQPIEYQIQFNASGSGYSIRTYTLTVGDYSSQILNAYLTSSTSTTLLTITDIDTAETLQDVLCSMYKYINGTWSPVESKNSDITGKAQFTYQPNINYKFVLSKDGYNNNIFYLNPILFSTYDIKLSKSTLMNITQDYDQLALTYTPTFRNNYNNTFNFLLSAPSGNLVNYGYILTYPTGIISNSGTNAIGGQLSSLVNISGATVFDKVQLYYYYTTTTGGIRNFTVNLPIEFVAGSTQTWADIKYTDWQLGIFERLVIVTIIMLGILGIASMVGQALPGFALTLIVLGYIIYIGFIPILVGIPTLIIGVFLLMWRMGGSN